MMPQLSETVFALGGTFIYQLLHLGAGIGGTLFAAFQRFDYDFVLSIVLAIIAIVMVGEIISGWMRRMFQ